MGKNIRVGILYLVNCYKMDLLKQTNILKKCYVIRVMTGKEKKYISSIQRELSQLDGRLIWPRRCLAIRKAGIKAEKISSLYPGYLFWETAELTDYSIMMLKQAAGFIRFLKSNSEIVAITKEEMYLLYNLIADEEIIRQSKVVFDEKNRIIVLDGPMKGMEGAIVKADRRKGRAKVLLTLHGKSFFVDLGFEVMDFHPDEAYRSSVSLFNRKSGISTTL
jgi:transcription termination/antitermination protein NusG